MSKSYLGKLGEAPVVMIIGPVAYWWDTDEYKHWDLPEHWHYVKWRERVNDALVENGYLVYRHWEAFKGTWNNKMQEVNNYVLDRSDFIVNIKPPYAWSDGCAEEMRYAFKSGRRQDVIFAPHLRLKKNFLGRLRLYSKTSPRGLMKNSLNLVLHAMASAAIAVGVYDVTGSRILLIGICLAAAWHFAFRSGVVF